MIRMVTIGVYGFTGKTFLQRLKRADVRLLLDVRQRRGIRGADYAWANSRRLQAALANAGIGYSYHPGLAPTTELRQLQNTEDDRQGVGKRSRRKLATRCELQTGCPFGPDRGDWSYQASDSLGGSK